MDRFPHCWSIYCIFQVKFHYSVADITHNMGCHGVISIYIYIRIFPQLSFLEIYSNPPPLQFISAAIDLFLPNTLTKPFMPVQAKGMAFFVNCILLEEWKAWIKRCVLSRLLLFTTWWQWNCGHLKTYEQICFAVENVTHVIWRLPVRVIYLKDI